MSEQNKKQKDNDPNSWANREKGAIWEFNDRLSISLKNKEGQEVRFVAFRNKFKTEPKHPAWRIYTELPNTKTGNSTKAATKRTTSKTVQNDEEFV